MKLIFFRILSLGMRRKPSAGVTLLGPVWRPVWQESDLGKSRSNIVKSWLKMSCCNKVMLLFFLFRPKHILRSSCQNTPTGPWAGPLLPGGVSLSITTNLLCPVKVLPYFFLKKKPGYFLYLQDTEICVSK